MDGGDAAWRGAGPGLHSGQKKRLARIPARHPLAAAGGAHGLFCRRVSNRKACSKTRQKLLTKSVCNTVDISPVFSLSDCLYVEIFTCSKNDVAALYTTLSIVLSTGNAYA